MVVLVRNIGNEINNTLGYINVSEGGFLPDYNEPSGFITDTTIDSSAPTSNLFNSDTLSVGRSAISGGQSQRSSFIVSVDLTKLPINGSYEIMSAFFTLQTKSTTIIDWCTFWARQGEGHSGCLRKTTKSKYPPCLRAKGRRDQVL